MAYYNTWRGCVIVFERRDHNFPLYVKHIRGGEVTWTTDYTYASHYSERTARKHNEAIKAKEYSNIKGLDFGKTASRWKYNVI